MRIDIDHLPDRNQRELERIVRAIFEEFEDAHKLATGDRKLARILKVILYGSFARGTWIYEPHTEKAYASDYDILVIVNHDDAAKDLYWLDLEERLSREFSILQSMRHPVSLIVHTLQEVNRNLTQGRFFFTDMMKDGIALYQSDDSELAAPRPKAPADALAMAEEYFEDWFPTAGEFYDSYLDDFARKRYKKAAFELHQAAERLYHTVLLTRTFYTPHSHNLEHLRNLARKLDRRLLHVWPNDDKTDRRRFGLLKDAYVKARYSKHYHISEEDLAWLGERVKDLSSAVQAVTADHIETLRQQAAAASE
ncbi:MAG: nucleotidyltransferase [Novosphingobium sp.]|nr:nucleotidyltransferase [Novosphingobium sp.]